MADTHLTCGDNRLILTTLVGVVLGAALGLSDAMTSDHWWSLFVALAPWVLHVARGSRSRWHPPRRWPCGVLITTLLVAASTSTRLHHVPESSFVGRLPPRGQLVHAVVRVVDPGLHGPRSHGPMARFDHRPNARVSVVDLVMVEDEGGELQHVTGRLFLRVDGLDDTLAELTPGTLLSIHGRIGTFDRANNPGSSADVVEESKIPGWLVVPDARLIQPYDRRGSGLLETFLRCRQVVLTHIQHTLESIPATGEVRSVVEAVTLGIRTGDYNGVAASFRRVGAAHILAISGLHLGLLAACLLVVVGGGKGRSATHMAVLLMASGVLATVVVMRMPLLRAVAMVVVTGFLMMLGRRPQLVVVVSLTATTIILISPVELLHPGFQLTFLVVGALCLHSSSPRVRWWATHRPQRSRKRMIVWQWVRRGLTTGGVAWGAAVPIIIHHFGMISPWTIPLAIVMVPMLTVTLISAVVHIIVAPLIPELTSVTGWIAARCGQGMVNVVGWVEQLPLSVVMVKDPGVGWMITAMICWLAMVARWGHIVARLSFGCLVVTWFVAAQTPVSIDGVRLDVLNVGDGSCFLVRSGTATAMVDCGAVNTPDLAPRVIAPALQSLGITAIDHLIITHGHFDHCGGVSDLIEMGIVKEVLVTSQFLEIACRGTPGGLAMEAAGQAGIPVRVIGGGDHLELGSADVTWIHPTPSTPPEPVNDASLVSVIQTGGRTLLLCGDIEPSIIPAVNKRVPGGEVDVMELPHHGAWSQAAEAMIGSLKPQIVFQSTGWSRVDDDRWRDQPSIDQWLCTARDGALMIHLSVDGSITTSTYTHHTAIQEDVP